MGDWEESLSPRARERLARAGEVTADERERMKATEQLGSLLSEYYTGQLNAEGLWRELKGFQERGKAYVLKEAQLKLLDSLTLTSTHAEFQRRKEGVLAIETLKGEQDVSTVEAGLNTLEGLQERCEEEKRQAYESLKVQVQRNPDLRLQQVKQGQNTMVVQLSVDEAVKRLPQWQDFAHQHERRYNEEFSRLAERLRAGLT